MVGNAIATATADDAGATAGASGADADAASTADAAVAGRTVRRAVVAQTGVGESQIRALAAAIEAAAAEADARRSVACQRLATGVVVLGGGRRAGIAVAVRGSRALFLLDTVCLISCCCCLSLISLPADG